MSTILQNLATHFKTPKPTRPPLWAHQRKSLKFLVRHLRVFDMSSPGTGKTRVHLEAFARRRKAGGGCALVVAPKSLLQSAWGNDIDKYTPHLAYAIAYVEQRAHTFMDPADLYLINTDGVRWLAQQKPTFFKPFDTLIIDESSYFKHRTSQRSKALRKSVKYFHYRVLLTGTPNSNSITDIWHQVLLLDDGQRLGTQFFGFRASVCAPEQVGPGVNHLKWIDKPGAEAAVYGLISDITLRHAFDDCMGIPPNHTYTVPYVLPTKLRAQYRELEDRALLELEAGHVTAIHAASLRTKLLQVACITRDTPVLTHRGWVAIQNVRGTDKVWDGTEWVHHQGSVCKGTEHVIECCGVWMTPEHKVLTNRGWQTARDCTHGEPRNRPYRQSVRLPDGYASCRHDHWLDPKSDVAVSLCVRQSSGTNQSVITIEASSQRKTLWLPQHRDVDYARYDQHQALPYLVKHAASLYQQARQGLQKLRRTWNMRMSTMAALFRNLLERHAGLLRTAFDAWPYRQQQRLLPEQLSLGDKQAASQQHTIQCVYRHAHRTHDDHAGSSGVRDQKRHAPRPPQTQQVAGSARTEFVYDLVNCGPRTRFVVLDRYRSPLIVHNSGAVYREDHDYSVLDTARYELVLDLVEQVPHSVVFFNWRHVREELEKAAFRRGLSFAAIDGTVSQALRESYVAQFQAGFLQTLFLHPKTGAHGLTLTRGTRTIWVSPIYEPDFLEQGKHRIYRGGQTHKTETLLIEAAHTVERLVYQRLNDKGARMDDLLTMIKEHRQ